MDTEEKIVLKTTSFINIKKRIIDMKHTLLLFLMIGVLLSGCTMTGRAVQEVEKVPSLEERDSEDIKKAVDEKDITICYSIQTQHIREACFIKLAQEMEDPSICSNLLGKSLKESCKAGIE